MSASKTSTSSPAANFGAPSAASVPSSMREAGRAGLRGAVGVEDEPPGEGAPDLLADALGQRGGAVGHRDQRREVPPVRLGEDRVRDRAAHRVAEEGQRVDAGLLDQVEDRLGARSWARCRAPRWRRTTWPLPRIHWLPPCIIGPQASITIGDSLAAASAARCSTDSIGRPEAGSVERGLDQVLVAPDDALRAPGGAAGVEDVGVVGRAALEPVGGRRGQRRVVVLAEDEDVLERRQVERGDGLDVLGRDDRRDAVGVVVEVGQLVVEVLVVDVDRHRPRLEAAVERVDPLDPVRRVDRDVVAGRTPERDQVVGQPRGAVVDLRVGVVAVDGGDGDPVGNGVRDSLEDVGEVERACGHESSELGELSEDPVHHGGGVDRADRSSVRLALPTYSTGAVPVNLRPLAVRPRRRAAGPFRLRRRRERHLRLGRRQR